MVDAVLIVALLLGAIISFGMFWRNRAKQMPATMTVASAPHGGASSVKFLRPADQIEIQSAQALLDATGTSALVEEIRTLLGLNPQNYEEDVLCVLHRYAEFVQLLPASESHHHAQPGGLLEHTLEVAVNALKIRQGYKLPLQAAVEDQIRLGAVWSYGILIAALLHDIGKPVSDVVVQLYGVDAAQPLLRWNGLAGSMLDQSKVSHYSVTFPSNKSYAVHARLPITLIQSMLANRSRAWLATDPALFNELVQYLDGQPLAGSIISEIVSKADSLSVARNLKAGSRVRFSSSRTPPLIERLMGGLRALLIEGLVPFNRPGAAAFVDADGEHIWLVAGTAANQVRDLLNSREQRAGQSLGLPTDNARFFDTWSEYGALVIPPAEFGRGSVWWVRVEFEGWQKILTMLKFPLNKLFADGQRPPIANVAMTLSPVSPDTNRDLAESTDVPSSIAATVDPTEDLAGHLTAQGAGEMVQLQSNPQETPAYALQSYSAESFSTPVATAISTDAPSVYPLQPADPPVISRDLEFLDDTQSASSALQTVRATPSGAGAVKPHRAAARLPKALFKAPGATAPRPNADSFINWVKVGLSLDPDADSDALSFNRVDSMIHFVDDGMVLVTPKIFKHFLEQHTFIGDVGVSKDPLRALQNELNKAGYFSKASGASSFHRFQTKSEDGTLGTPFNACLIPNPHAYVKPVPASNPLLAKATTPPAPRRAFKPATPSNTE
jgi:integrating conjugative element relaxase (TIGR03760 family)